MTPIRRAPVIVSACIVAFAVLVPVLPIADPMQVDLAHQLDGPSVTHWLGQDEQGRDVLSRLLWSARGSLFVAFTSALFACSVALALGQLSAMRRFAFLVVQVVRGFPPLMLPLLFVTLSGPGFGTLIAVIAIILVPGFLLIKNRSVPAVLTQFVAACMAALILESGLSFLGLGIAPSSPSWGGMIAEARNVMMQAPLLVLWPSAALSLTIFALNELRKSLREVAEPQPRRFARQRSDTRPPSAPGRPPTGGAVLDVRGMCIDLSTPAGTKHILRDASFTLRAGETLAVAGEAGSGKSLMALALLGLLPAAVHVTKGSAWLQGHNLLRLDEVAFSRVRGGVLSMVLQNAQGSFNPVQRIGAQIEEVMHAHFAMSAHEAKDEAEALLTRVGIPDAKQGARAYPHELSDEMRFRATIAMAIANDPRLLIVDEPIAIFDATAQSEILALLADLRRELGMGLIFLTRNLNAATGFADRVLILQEGQLVEHSTPVIAPTQRVRSNSI